MVETKNLVAKIVNSISEIPKTSWDACNNASANSSPFLSYDFLNALEISGCVNAETGWHPQHVVLYNTSDETDILAVMPLYLKGHSQGEYVFDHGWADAYERAGGRYYPKLQSSIPFTPATASKLLVKDCNNRQTYEQALISSAIQFARNAEISSLHLTFVPEREAASYKDMGLLIRNDQQFHWFNKGYQTFDDFLNALSSRKRKQIRKERRTALENGITIHHFSGDDLKEEHWDAFFEFYIDTGNRKWGQPYLNRQFFSEINKRMADKIVLMMCERGGDYIAGALNFIGSDTIYGRHWGCIEDHPCLHFETCYYQAIEYAINHGLKCVEAGAQGPHKIARGYEPTKTYSAHYLRDEGFHKAVENFLQMETREVDAHIEYLGERTPFKKGD
ncbi:GNAT family N-acetyltransferase [Kordiimonas sp. SCSIO 12610]|uniref:GNAT family N-acetyltransferase n=1 Tax=Kordiimonas sp. SCSIO 12610 TaxID=2829597 RepID=UPI002109A114|nr:GNAT family N-acetyltransferase [Kordiimonas sp. SCSIO 12610]UTW54270.1 N-acetyltransferase [Kordiimonas sp. SCSIO 12610]